MKKKEGRWVGQRRRRQERLSKREEARDKVNAQHDHHEQAIGANKKRLPGHRDGDAYASRAGEVHCTKRAANRKKGGETYKRRSIERRAMDIERGSGSAFSRRNMQEQVRRRTSEQKTEMTHDKQEDEKGGKDKRLPRKN